ncbi:prephenate dehydrogenase [Cytobacillus spongiae]|jgi:prephenate dehydrogenase|uniref:prephenate dehydrogenase n=1 Tax=Cytobacillus spongiae TaxID=2901381 RepID=UPI001F3CF072|nr:prephenate dehydrogenase [Cytobacillus spongiae]UII54632.1 prephenate dehydrogenase [Cytobacillus spongiae]
MNGQVFLIGLGLIGGSLALSIREQHPQSRIVGYDINDEQCKLAKMLGVIDEAAETIEAGAKDADLIIIATPVLEVERILTVLETISLKRDVIITDAGSTKLTIVKKAAALKTKGITFIGGHPMAGSHKSGVSAAKTLLFENAFYLLTPEEDIKEEYIAKLQHWLQGTKAKFLVITPEEHDLLTGVISHFPHVIAASLVHQAKLTSQDQKLVTRLAAGGFRDITRIASSSPEMWRDILIHNKDVLLSLFHQWKMEMSKVETMLLEENEEKIYHYFLAAKEFRDELPQKQKGAIPAFYDLFVDVPDYPGIISEVTGYLAKEEISITNIRILETREDINGVLVISFQTEEDRSKAEKCLSTYTTYQTSIGP